MVKRRTTVRRLADVSRRSVISLPMTALVTSSAATSNGLPVSSVTFRTNDVDLQRLFDAAEAKAASNIVQFTPSMKILVEGGGYNNAWIETQPLGGEMYAKRSIEIALNNQRVFMLGQRSDGRMPGMVISTEASRKAGRDKQPPEGMIWLPEAQVLADYEMFQGYCYPDPAWKTYFWIGKDRGYLQTLYRALEAHDAYLWRTRDSNGDGLLESWCMWDTGEDRSTRLSTRNVPTRWPFDFAPTGARLPDPQDPGNYKRYWHDHFINNLPAPTREQVMAPFASMDVMSYSFDGRNTLAKVARELGNDQGEVWKRKAEQVRRRVIDGLWDPDRHACFDRDRTGKRLDELIHNNLRVMHHGLFTQPMADAFIQHHLLNPAEFWTPIPLVSIAINERLYRSEEGNNWSGQPQGLTYQRAIRAMENYGHYAEVSLLGQKLLHALIRNGCTFAQQLDARNGKPSGPRPDGYGPMILAALEYMSRMHGVHIEIEKGHVWWSALTNGGKEFIYTQRWGERAWTLSCAKTRFKASLNGRDLFSCTAGVRVVTDLDGNLLAVVGIDQRRHRATFQSGGNSHQLTVSPNEVYRYDRKQLVLQRAAPFVYPYRNSKENRNRVNTEPNGTLD